MNEPWEQLELDFGDQSQSVSVHVPKGPDTELNHSGEQSGDPQCEGRNGEAKSPNPVPNSTEDGNALALSAIRMKREEVAKRYEEFFARHGRY